MSEIDITLPVRADDDAELIDASGLRLAYFLAASEPEIDHIVTAVNYHKRLVEVLSEASELDHMSMENAVGWIEDNCQSIRDILAELDTKKD